MDLDIQKLSFFLNNYFNYEEIRTLFFELNVDFELIAGESKSSKIRELISYLQRTRRLAELVQTAQRERPHVNWNSVIREQHYSEHSDPNLDAEVLNVELASLRQQLNEIRKGTISSEQLDSRIEEMLRTANRAIGRSEEITARVILPPSELTDVQLLPSGMLERLEEYRSDENLAYLLVGAFGGAILGILSNWATNDPFVITRFSVVLLILILLLTATSIFWAWRLKKRADSVKRQIFSNKFSTDNK